MCSLRVSAPPPQGKILGVHLSYSARKSYLFCAVVVCLAVPYFLHCLINGTFFGKNLVDIKCVFTFSTSFV
jgi:hypothetical protein